MISISYSYCALSLSTYFQYAARKFPTIWSARGHVKVAPSNPFGSSLVLDRLPSTALSAPSLKVGIDYAAYIERGSPWENGYIESFNARLRDELLDGEIFYSLRYARRRSSLRVGDVTTIASGRTGPLVTLRARARCVAGCATSTGSAGLASA